MKGVIELNWKILIFIISGILLLLIVILILFGMIDTCALSAGAREGCLLLISKLQFLGHGASALKICDIFQECPQG